MAKIDNLLFTAYTDLAQATRKLQKAGILGLSVEAQALADRVLQIRNALLDDEPIPMNKSVQERLSTGTPSGSLEQYAQE